MSAYRTAVGWVVSTLSTDATVTAAVGTRIHEGVVPSSVGYPLVTVQAYTDPVDTNYAGARALTVVDLVVRVWGSFDASRGSSSAELVAVADRIDVLLNAAGPVVRDGGTIAGCVRTNEMSSAEERSGAIVRSAGGRYRVTVS